MKFTPMNFQISVAAGGVALMPFVLMQFALPHGEGMITLNSMPWSGMGIVHQMVYAPLVGVMFLFVVLHLLLTVVYLKGLAGWLADREQVKSMINNPKFNIGLFSPIASISMTANVLWGPLAFFVPSLSGILQGLMLPSLIYFMVLLLLLLALEAKVLNVWMTQPVDPVELNFPWLLDVFTFGLVSLTGTGIAAISGDAAIASVAAFGSFFSICIGLFVFTVKIISVIYGQARAHTLPGAPMLPAYFLVIPISCLFGISLFRIMGYLKNHFGFEVMVPSFMILNFAYVIALGWGVFCICLLTGYLRNFMNESYSPAQWGMI